MVSHTWCFITHLSSFLFQAMQWSKDYFSYKDPKEQTVRTTIVFTGFFYCFHLVVNGWMDACNLRWWTSNNATKLQLQNCLLVMLMVKIWPYCYTFNNKFLNVLLIQTELPCWNLVCWTYPMLATTNPIYIMCKYDRHTENYGLQLINLVSSLFSISPMVALFVAQKKTLLLHTLWYVHHDPTIAYIIPKIATSFTRTQVLLCKNEKYQCAKIRFLCAKVQDLLEPMWLFVQVKETTVDPTFGSNRIPTEGFTSVPQ